MGKLAGSIFILFFLLLMAPQPLLAQSFFQRLFHQSDYPGGGGRLKKIIRQKRFHCGEMDAYNKKRAFRRHKKGTLERIFVGRTSKSSGGSPTTESNPQKSSSPPARTSTTSTPKTATSKKQPPQVNKPKPAPPTDTPPPVTQNRKDLPKDTSPALENKRETELLTRTALKKMTRNERLDTLLQKEPDIILTPLEFISDQDEFSVVNMDSFIQAMEYAQQGKIVLVEGHTDDVGSEAYNLDLSMKRAEKIRELLLSGGISDELISVIGYGETQPRVPNTSDINRAKNRRIEFKIFFLPE